MTSSHSIPHGPARRMVRIASCEMVYSPGLWKFFENAVKTQSQTWSVAFLKAFTCDRLTAKECQRIVAGNYRTAVEPHDTVVLEVM